MEELEKKMNASSLELVQVRAFDGYEVENPTWIFLHYAIVQNEVDCKVDFLNKRVYASLEQDEKEHFYQRENLQIGDVRAVRAPQNLQFQKYLEKHGNTLSVVANYICESGLYFPYGQYGKHRVEPLQLCQFKAYYKSLKR